MQDARYRGLDGLRGLAAFMVIVHHTALQGTDIGGLSVFLFFILSGFLITGILVRMRGKIEAGKVTVWASLKTFWLQRALRIFPAYYVWLAVFLPIDWYWFDGETIAHLGWYLAYLQNFLIAFVTYGWQDFTHTWSLAVEQQYYTFFAPLVLIVPLLWQRAFFWSVMAACFAVIVFLMSRGFEMVTLYPTPSTGFVFMAAGALLSVTKRERLAPFAHPFAVIGAAVLLVVLASYPVLERNQILRVPYVLLVAGSVISLTTLMAATLASPGAWLVGILETRIPKFYGLISYALYIIHLPVALWVDRFTDLSRFGAPIGLSRNMVDFVVVAAVSTVLATFSYYAVERPFLRLKDRLKDRGTA